jgi:transcriptional regulator with XRE-family HTH domain
MSQQVIRKHVFGNEESSSGEQLFFELLITECAGGQNRGPSCAHGWRKIMAMRIKMARNRMSFSQTRLQLESGLGASVLSHVELGSRLPSLETFVTITTALHVSPDWLLGLPQRKSPWQLMHQPSTNWELVIGPRLRSVRHHRGMNRAALARATGIAATTIASIENSRRFPSMGNLVSLCLSLKVSVRWLLGLPRIAQSAIS